jgi:hypothetical protein
MTSVCSNRDLAGSTRSASRAVSVSRLSTTTRNSRARKASRTRAVSGFWVSGLPRSTQAAFSGGPSWAAMSRPSRAAATVQRTCGSGTRGG